MNQLAKLAIVNIAKVKALDKELDTLRESTRTEASHLQYDVYRDKIRLIEAERDQKLEEVQKKGEEAEAVKHDELVKLQATVLQVKRILEYLNLDATKNLEISDNDIQFSSYHQDFYKESLGFYLDDTYFKVKLYIVQNEKPTNKYSLVALGKCLFHEDMLKLPRYYGASFHTRDRYELEAGLKDAPTIEQAKAWLQKNRDKLFEEDLFARYVAVKNEYDETMQNYKLDDFQQFLIARCDCGNFSTIWEDYILREQHPTCSRCNKPLTIIPNDLRPY